MLAGGVGAAASGLLFHGLGRCAGKTWDALKKSIDLPVNNSSIYETLKPAAKDFEEEISKAFPKINGRLSHAKKRLLRITWDNYKSAAESQKLRKIYNKTIKTLGIIRDKANDGSDSFISSMLNLRDLFNAINEQEACA